MKTLADAWDWYQATKRNLTRMRRFGSKHWNDDSLKNASLWQDDEFRAVEATEVVAETATSLRPIDDLAVVVLFSVFESQVRDYLGARMRPEVDALSDPILKEAAEEALQGVKEGSFARRVLGPLKEQGLVTADLVEKVNQVRKYRNWVAHGRREGDTETSNVTPRVAYDRLREFLAELRIAIEPEQIGPERPGFEQE